MNIRNLYPGAMASNCYLLTVGAHAAVVDPSPAPETVLAELQKENAALEMILLTHGHFDHVFGMDGLRKATGAPVYVHKNDFAMPDDPEQNVFLRVFGMERRFGKPDRSLSDGDTLMLNGETIRVIHTPGHTAGCVCYLCNDEFLITGDTLFAGTHGRTDVYSSNAGDMVSSLLRLRELPQTLPIYPGHGSPAVLGTALDTVIY